jgi:hypothetical protein
MNKTIEFEYNNNIVEAEIYFMEVDASFSHEFGIERRTELEVDTVEILSCTNEEGEETIYDKKEVEGLAVDEFYNSL